MALCAASMLWSYSVDKASNIVSSYHISVTFTVGKKESDVEFILCLWTITQHSCLKQCEINFRRTIEEKPP